MVWLSASAAENTCDCGDGIQRPMERKPVCFMGEWDRSPELLTSRRRTFTRAERMLFCHYYEKRGKNCRLPTGVMKPTMTSVATSLSLLTSRGADLDEARDELAVVVRTHYASEERMADLLERLGKPASSAFIRNSLPQGKRIRSGDLGEILASEYVDENTVYSLPIKRLRWKKPSRNVNARRRRNRRARERR